MTVRSATPPSWREDLLVVVPAWVCARLLVALGFLVADAVAHDQGRDPVALRQGLWMWDGSFYRDIAEVGYGAVSGAPLRFFPLYPLAARGLGPLLGGRSDLALLVVANLAAVVAAVLLRRLALLETDDRALADRAAWLLLLLPPAFVLSIAYSEALFLVLTIGCFLAVRQGRWWPAAGLAAGAALTRPVGLVLVVPLAVELVRQWPDLGRRRAVAVLALVAPVAGTGAYLAYSRWRFDAWTAPYRSQEGFRGDVVDPVSRLVRGIGDVVGDPFGDGLHVPFAVAGVAMVVVVARRWPAPYAVYSAVMVAIALSAENLNSLERYLLATFPLVLALAGLVRGERAERLVLALCGAGTMALTALALLGAYVP